MILYELIRESHISKYFRLYAPYNVDIDVAPGQNRTATFVANQPGIFLYACKYHAPSMVGQLIILPHQANYNKLDWIARRICRTAILSSTVISLHFVKTSKDIKKEKMSTTLIALGIRQYIKVHLF